MRESIKRLYDLPACSEVGRLLNDFLAGPEGSGEKTSKMRLGMIQGRKNQNYVYEYFLHISVLVIDCYWCGFGGIQDRVDLRIPPDIIAVY
jgi:hypothetical protein